MRSWARWSICWPFLACLKGSAQIVPSLQLFKSNISIILCLKNYDIIFSLFLMPRRTGKCKNISCIWKFIIIHSSQFFDARSRDRRQIYWPFLACLKVVVQIAPEWPPYYGYIFIFLYSENYETIFFSMLTLFRI